MRHSLRQPLIRSSVWVAIFAIWAHWAAAIDIVIQLQNEGQNPAFDPNGTRMKAIFEAAAQIWEDYLPQSKTYEVDIWWSVDEFDSPDDAGVLGRWSNQFGGDNNIRLNASVGNWFIDDDPLDHSEFQLAQTLYRSLNSTLQSQWVHGNPPGLLEVGYGGSATGLIKASESTSSSSSLSNLTDMLSVALHELGHELGVNSSSGSWELDSSFLPTGSGVAVENAEGGHLRAQTALMTDALSNGIRRLPSAIDIMAVAQDQG